MKHTERCEKDKVRIEKEREEYAKKWPGYCLTCEGWGGEWYEFDPSPGGISLGAGTLSDFEDCPDCLGVGQCARCGREEIEGWGEDDMTCPGCGANFRDDNVGMPQDYCGEIAAEKMIDEAERVLEELRGNDEC